MAGVAYVDVDRKKDAVALVGRDAGCLGQAGVEAAAADLGHLVGAEALDRHPVQRLRGWPVPAQAHLQEPVPAHRPGLEQPAHRLTVAPQRPELDVAGVGVRVEVNHRDTAVTEDVGHALGVGVGDRVVAAEDERDRAGPGDLLDCGLQGREGRLDVA